MKTNQPLSKFNRYVKSDLYNGEETQILYFVKNNKENNRTRG